jgi:hypothetical protein
VSLCVVTPFYAVRFMIRLSRSFDYPWPAPR